MEMYAKCESMGSAWTVFQEMYSRDVVSWTTLMLGYVNNRQPEVALDLFHRMEHCEPDSRAYVAAFSACASLADREEARPINGTVLKIESLQEVMAIHSQLRKRSKGGNDFEGFKEFEQVFLANSLLDTYCRCGALEDAHRVFGKARTGQQDASLWTSLILGYAENGENEEALRLFHSMGGVTPNSRTFVAALVACAGLGAQEQGNLLSGKLVKLSSLDKGMDIHSQAASAGFGSDIFVANTLIDMYSKCGSLTDARKIFDRLDCHSIVSWTALILGYVENGENELALELFRRVSCSPNSLTYAAAINACGNMLALAAGRQIHLEAENSGLQTNELVLANSLVNFYVKCGDLVSAEKIFKSMSRRDLASWSSLISGYSSIGSSIEVFGLFQELELEGLEPDSVTYLSVLASCSHAGLVAKAKECFQAMVSDPSRSKPGITHYDCMIDMLGRANLINEAVALAKEYEAGVVAWTAILSTSREWRGVAVAEQAFDNLVKIDGSRSVAYVLMANIVGSLEEMNAACHTDEINLVTTSKLLSRNV